MTNITLRAPAQTSAFNGTVASLFMTAMVVLSGFLSLGVLKNSQPADLLR